MSPDRISLRPQDLEQVLNRYLERLRRHREALNRLRAYPVPEGLATILAYLPGRDPGATAAAMAAASGVLDRMVGNDSDVVTIITGVAAEETITDAITSRFGQAHPKVAVEVVFGGQPQYPYVFGVE